MAAPYLSHRQRVELAIPARLVFGIVICDCFSDPDADVVAELKRLLTDACVEPISDLSAKEASRVARRVDRISQAAAKEFDDQPAVKIAIALFYFIQDLLEREVLVLWDDSSFGKAINLLIPMFEHGFEQEKIDKSAQKKARQLLSFFNREGLYQ